MSRSKKSTKRRANDSKRSKSVPLTPSAIGPKADIHVARPEPSRPWVTALAVATIAAVATGVAQFASVATFAAPLAASLVLVAAQPEAPSAQPRAVVGGHLVAAIAAVLVTTYAPYPPLHLFLALFIAVVAMFELGLVHAPAAATVYFVTTNRMGWSFIAAPLLPGLAILIVGGIAFHRARGQRYPKSWVEALRAPTPTGPTASPSAAVAR